MRWYKVPIQILLHAKFVECSRVRKGHNRSQVLATIQDRLVYFVNKIPGVSDTDSQGDLEERRNHLSKMTSLPEEEAILFDNYSYYDGDYPVYEEGDIPAIPLDGKPIEN